MDTSNPTSNENPGTKNSLAFDDLFDNSIDKISESIKNIFGTLPKDKQRNIVLSIIDCVDRECDDIEILTMLLSKIPGNSKKIKAISYCVEDDLTFEQVFLTYSGVSSKEEITNKIESNKLIGYLDDDGVMKVPACQFHNGELLPCIDDLISLVGNGKNAVNALKCKPDTLNGETTYEYLRREDSVSDILATLIVLFELD